MNNTTTNTQYQQVITTRELVGTYWVKAEDRVQAEEIAWDKFDEERHNGQLDDCWDYHTIGEEIYDAKEGDHEWITLEDVEVA